MKTLWESLRTVNKETLSLLSSSKSAIPYCRINSQCTPHHSFHSDCLHCELLVVKSSKKPNRLHQILPRCHCCVCQKRENGIALRIKWRFCRCLLVHEIIPYLLQIGCLLMRYTLFILYSKSIICIICISTVSLVNSQTVHLNKSVWKYTNIPFHTKKKTHSRQFLFNLAPWGNRYKYFKYY